VERKDLSDLLVEFLRVAMLQEYRSNAAFRDYFENEALFEQRLTEVSPALCSAWRPLCLTTLA
jgi:hypothetical protein